MEDLYRKKRELRRRGKGLRGLRPFAPAVSMQSVRLEPAPKGGPADSKLSGGFRQLPAVSVQRLDDSLLLPRRQRRGALNARHEHRLTQLHAADSKRAQPPTQGREAGLEVWSSLREIPILQCLAGRLVGVQDPTAVVENDDPFAESVQDGLGERREDRRELVKRDSLCHATRYGFIGGKFQSVTSARQSNFRLRPN